MRRTKTVLVAVFMTVRQLTLRHAWALSAFTVLTGLVLSVSLVVPSEASRARESVARSSTPEEPALLREENSAAHSQYVENSSPEPSLPGVSRRGGGLPRTILDEKIPPGSSRPRGPQDAIDPDSRNFVSQGSIADGPILREEHFSPYSQVVDNSMPGRFRAPGWDVRSSNPDGYQRGRSWRGSRWRYPPPTSTLSMPGGLLTGTKPPRHASASAPPQESAGPG